MNDYILVGISTIPSIFQRQMEYILEDIPGVCVYLDDIVVMGTDRNNHLHNLSEVLKHLESAGLTVQKSKCTFYTTSIKYLGHVIDSTGLHPSPLKIEAISRGCAITYYSAVCPSWHNQSYKQMNG